jgi:hypothetical protein
MGINMQKQPSVYPATQFRKPEVSITQKARAESLRQADLDRAEKRLRDDARIDVNAAKWRYVCTGS